MTSLIDNQHPGRTGATDDAHLDPMVPRPHRISRTRQDTRDTFTLELEPIDGPLLRYQAGQFTMLDAFGVGEVPISISGDPTTPGPLEHTIRDVGVVTHALITAPAGAVVGVRCRSTSLRARAGRPDRLYKR